MCIFERERFCRRQMNKTTVVEQRMRRWKKFSYFFREVWVAMAVSCSESIDIMQRKSLSHYKEIFQVDAFECRVGIEVARARDKEWRDCMLRWNCEFSIARHNIGGNVKINKLWLASNLINKIRIRISNVDGD